jgi:hypothetical protein
LATGAGPPLTSGEHVNDHLTVGEVGGTEVHVSSPVDAAAVLDANAAAGSIFDRFGGPIMWS